MISQRFWPLTIWTVLLTGVAFAFFSFLSGRGNDLLSVSRFLLKEVRRGEALSDEQEKIRHHNEEKQRLAEEVIAGHITLRQAADEFDALRHETLGARYDFFMRTIREHKGSCDLRREVMNWIEYSLQEKPAQAAAVLDRLKKECTEEVHGGQFAHGS
jgi:hypothetical protein